jgi:hypothetical protein
VGESSTAPVHSRRSLWGDSILLLLPYGHLELGYQAPSAAVESGFNTQETIAQAENCSTVEYKSEKFQR